jgi:uncharacterized RDD family membrane protein YckC
MPVDDPRPAPEPAALIGRRLLSLLYDMLPVLALWFLMAVPFVLVDVAISGDVRHNIGPFSTMQWLLWLACWLATGLYATLSWRRGGQTLGMRPWRLRVVGLDGAPAPWRCLWLRYATGVLSLLAAGLGFWWAWFDRDRLTWHDRLSGTRMVRLPKRRKHGATADGGMPP